MYRLTVELPESVPAQEALLELAIVLFQSGRLTQGQAAQTAGLSREAFITLLGSRGVPFTNIDAADFEEEIATWRKLRSQTARP